MYMYDKQLTTLCKCQMYLQSSNAGYASFPGPAQLAITCSTEKRDLGTKLNIIMHAISNFQPTFNRR